MRHYVSLRQAPVHGLRRQSILTVNECKMHQRNRTLVPTLVTYDAANVLL